jgi:hypothetical protein
VEEAPRGPRGTGELDDQGDPNILEDVDDD